MGNDVAGVKVSPVVLDCPVDSPETNKLELEFPEVFTACVVTRAQAKKRVEEAKAEKEVVNSTFSDLSDSLLSQWNDSSGLPAEVDDRKPESITVSDENQDQGQEGVDLREGGTGEEEEVPVGDDEVPLSCDQLVQKQREDSSLRHVLKLAVTVQEAKEMPKCYFFHDDVLVRKWRPPTRPAAVDWTTFFNKWCYLSVTEGR